MRAEKVRELDDGELQAKEMELFEQIFRLRIKKSTGQLDQPGKIRVLQKDLARVKTVLSERRQAKTP